MVSIEGNLAVVSPDKTSACGSCSVKNGCGTASLSRFFGQRSQAFRARNLINARPGDRVVMGLEEASLVRGSIIVYLVPILGMISGAMLLSAWAGMSGLNQEFMALIGLLAGLAISGIFARYLTRRVADGMQPEIIRLDTTGR